MIKKKLAIILLVLGFYYNCNPDRQPILILISKDSDKHIAKWLISIDSSIIVKEAYKMKKDSLKFYMQKAGGFVIGGGEDVNPELYHKPEYKNVCEEPDNYRDSLELIMINYAFKNKTALLGICRGLQILNVARGGSLIPDIPSYKINSKINHRSKEEKAHKIIPVKSSCISKLNTNKQFWVNSKHHQCIDKLGKGYKIAAFAEDSIIESIEIQDTLKYGFVIGIQWHPEILIDDNSFNLGKKFLNKAALSKKL